MIDEYQLDANIQAIIILFSKLGWEFIMCVRTIFEIYILA